MADFSLESTELSEISEALRKQFEAFKNKEPEAARAEHANNVLVFDSELKYGVKELVPVFARVIPGKLFVVEISKERTETILPKTGVFAHKISEGEYLCSDVIYLRVDQSHISAVRNIVEGNRNTGFSCTLFLWSKNISNTTFDSLTSFCEAIVVDSAGSNLLDKFFRKVSEINKSVSDLSWVGLRQWRDRIRVVFNRPPVYRTLDTLEYIRITTGSEGIGFLLTGWIVHMLGLSIETFSAKGFECLARSGKKVYVAVEMKTEHKEVIHEVIFSSKFNEDKEVAFVKLWREDRFYAAVNVGTGFHVSAILEEEDWESRLERLILIGDSSTNYRPALKNALELLSLQKGYNSGKSS